MVYFTSQWICDKNGCWSELTKAKLTGDNTAKKNFRKDYDGGVLDEKFYLKNCGFFNSSTKLNSLFEKKPSASNQPIINFESLL